MGLANTNFPEASSTSYWSAQLSGTPGSVITVHGQYPLARFMGIDIYTSDTLVDYVNDVNIIPDAGQNNPFVSGTVNGTFTASVVFGVKPANPPPNTIYAGTLNYITLDYRAYHATNPNDPAAGATNPVLPQLSFNGQALINCPVQPYIQPPTTVWDRLATSNWIGTPPTGTQILKSSVTPPWHIQSPATGHYFPNGANFYMGAQLSRQYLKPYGTNDMFVMRFLAATSPNTRAGEPVYENRQVRFWSVCTDDPYTTNVNRCIPDDGVLLDANGYATFVICDPGSAPSAAILAQYSAVWLPWGTLNLPTDVVYDRTHTAWGVNTPVQYYNTLIYRQTIANSTFTQSFQNISLLPQNQQQAAMGAYWPMGGYCTAANFQTYGYNCVSQAQ